MPYVIENKRVTTNASIFTVVVWGYNFFISNHFPDPAKEWICTLQINVHYMIESKPWFRNTCLQFFKALKRMQKNWRFQVELSLLNFSGVSGAIQKLYSPHNFGCLVQQAYWWHNISPDKGHELHVLSLVGISSVFYLFALSLWR